MDLTRLDNERLIPPSITARGVGSVARRQLPAFPVARMSLTRIQDPSCPQPGCPHPFGGRLLLVGLPPNGPKPNLTRLYLDAVAEGV